MTAGVVIGFDLGGTHLKGAVVDPLGAILHQSTTDVRTERGPDAVIADIVAQVDPLLERSGRSRTDLRGVGIGTPGPLRVSEGRVIRSVNLPGWHDVPLRDTLQSALSCPVAMDNDGNVAAFGEYWAATGNPIVEASTAEPNHDPAADDLVMFTLGTGVGAGIVIGGRIHHGYFENAAELGHMIVAIDGLPCPCGQRGCLEQYASAAAVARRVINAIDSGESCVLKVSRNSTPPIDAECVANAVRSGDALCTRVWDDACRMLAVACVNVQHSLNPRRIILGGGMAKAGAILFDGVRDHLRLNSWKLHDDIPTIEPGRLGYHAGVVGAAGLAWSLISPVTR